MLALNKAAVIGGAEALNKHMGEPDTPLERLDPLTRSRFLFLSEQALHGAEIAMFEARLRNRHQSRETGLPWSWAWGAWFFVVVGAIVVGYVAWSGAFRSVTGEGP